MDVGQILQCGITLYTRNLKLLSGTAAVVAVPAAVIQVVVMLLTVKSADLAQAHQLFGNAFHVPPTAQPQPQMQQVLHQETSYLAGIYLAILVPALAGPFISAAVMRGVSDLFTGRQTSRAQILRTAVNRFVPVLLLGVVFVTAVTFTAVATFWALFIGGVWLWVVWVLAEPAVAIDHVGVFASLGLSFNLVRGSWWRVCGVMAAAVFGTSMAAGMLTEIPVFTVLTSNHPSVVAYALISGVAGLLSLVFIQPFIATVRTVLYHDLYDHGPPLFADPGAQHGLPSQPVPHWQGPPDPYAGSGAPPWGQGQPGPTPGPGQSSPEQPGSYQGGYPEPPDNP